MIVEKALEGVSNPPILVEFIDKIAGNKRSDFANEHNCLDYETEIQKLINIKIEHTLPNDFSLGVPCV